MMRAVRFAAKLDFEICPNAWKAIRRYAPTIANASVSRLCEEIQRLFVRGASERSLHLAYDSGLLSALLPALSAWIAASSAHASALWASLKALDELSRETEAEITPAISFAALYWPLAAERLKGSRATEKRGNERYARRQAAEKVLSAVVQKYRLPRAVWMTAADIIELATRFAQKPNSEVSRDLRLLNHVLFPELLLGAKLLAKVGSIPGDCLAEWERAYGEFGPPSRLPEGHTLPNRPNPHRRRVRRRPRRREKEAAHAAS